MARKTSYGFERREREKAKAAKKAARAAARKEKADRRKAEKAGEVFEPEEAGAPEDSERLPPRD